jgi:hypothetical protein
MGFQKTWYSDRSIGPDSSMLKLKVLRVELPDEDLIDALS